MTRDPRALLWDARQAGRRILAFTGDHTFGDYEDNALLRSAVERQFEILGEALSQLSKIAPDDAERVPELPRIVAFRNLLIHGYATVDNRLVWDVLETKLPDLMDVLETMLDEWA